MIARRRGDAKTNAHQAALRLLGVRPCAGKVVTGDALFTPRDVAQAIRDAGGDYLLMVKDHQPALKAPIRAAWHDDADFSPYQRKQKAAAEQAAATPDKGHGRVERRRLTGTTALNDYRDGPDVGQVFEPERVRQVGQESTVEVVYGITSLGPGPAQRSLSSHLRVLYSGTVGMARSAGMFLRKRVLQWPHLQPPRRRCRAWCSSVSRARAACSRPS